MTVAHWRSFWRSFLRFVRASPHGLYKSQLKSALRAAAGQDLWCLVVLGVPDSCDVSSYGAVTRGTRFLTIHAKVGVVGKKIEVVAQSLDDRTREILRFRHGEVVERFIRCCKRAVLARQGR